MEAEFQQALIDLWRSPISGYVFILQRPDGTYFHSVEWTYVPYPYHTYEAYFADQASGCTIKYIGLLHVQFSGRGNRGFDGYINSWDKKPRYRMRDDSYEYHYEEPLPKATEEQQK